MWTFDQQIHPDPTVIDQIEHIFLESFPPEERVDFKRMIGEVEKGSRVLFIAQDNQEKVVGYAVLASLPDSNLYLGGYLAVMARLRNGGIGAQFMGFISDWLEKSGVGGMVFEVESDLDCSEDQKLLRERRIHFYERNGARQVDDAPSYRMPNLAGGGTIPMKLMWIPTSAGEADLSGDRLRQCIIEIYARIYRRGPGDPVLSAILEGLRCTNPNQSLSQS